MKIFVALGLLVVGIAVYTIGQPALIAVGGVSAGLIFSEVADYITTPRKAGVRSAPLSRKPETRSES